MIIMKKLSSLLIGCSLALAGAALAQQPVEQQSPSKGKRAPEKAHATQAQPGVNAAKPQERPGRQPGAMKDKKRTRATDLRTPRKLMSRLNRLAKRRMSPGPEKTEGLGRARNLQMHPRRGLMFQVSQRECRRTVGSSKLRSASEVKV